MKPKRKKVRRVKGFVKEYRGIENLSFEFALQEEFVETYKPLESGYRPATLLIEEEKKMNHLEPFPQDVNYKGFLFKFKLWFAKLIYRILKSHIRFEARKSLTTLQVYLIIYIFELKVSEVKFSNYEISEVRER